MIARTLAVLVALCVLSGCTLVEHAPAALGKPEGLAVGTAVRADALRTDPVYRTVLAQNFSAVTTENEAKFGFVEPSRSTFDFSGLDTIVDFADEHNMGVRGHTLVWGNDLPSWLVDGNWTTAEVAEILEHHIRSVVGHYRGRVATWDVVNEAVADNGELRNNFWLDKLGRSYIADAFRWAHEADPSAQLFYNDYGAEGMGTKSDAVFDLVNSLLAADVPIDGVGLQMHERVAAPTSPDQISENISRLANRGLRVNITELDVALPEVVLPTDLVRQAKIFHDVAMACRQTPGCDAVIVWGFTDRYSWVPMFIPGFDHATLLDEDLKAKPAFSGLADALHY